MAQCVDSELRDHAHRDPHSRVHVHCFEILQECEVIVPLVNVHGRKPGIVYFPADVQFESRHAPVVVHVKNPKVDMDQFVVIHYHNQCVVDPKLTLNALLEKYQKIARGGVPLDETP